MDGPQEALPRPGADHRPPEPRGDNRPGVPADGPGAQVATLPAAAVPPAHAPHLAFARPADPAPALATVQQVPLAAVPVEIGAKLLAGTNRFEIRLDPEELGRVEVRLDIDDAGGVKAQLVVDRVDTLALLQRDAKTLERAFEQAGLRPSESGIDLSLRDPQADARGQHRGDGEPRRPDWAQPKDPPPEPDNEAPARIIRGLWRSSRGVDRRI
jgi:flagellar hook-length control protein FliK